MKRSTVSRKIVRAIAFGLATMMLATSVPVATYAEDGTTSQQSEEREITVENLIEECDNPPSEDNPSPEPVGAKQAIDEACDDTNDETVKGLLNDASVKIESAKDQLDDLQESGNEIVSDDSEPPLNDTLNDLMTVVNKPAVDENGNPVFVQAVDENGNPRFDENGNPVFAQETDENGDPKFDENGNPVYVQLLMIDYVLSKTDEDLGAAEKSATEAGGNVDVANNSSDETEARAAAAAFDSEVKKVGEDLDEVGKTVEELQTKVDNAQKAVDEASKTLQEDQKELYKLQDNCKQGAIKDTSAALAALKVAKDKVDADVALVDAKDYEKNQTEYELLSKLYNDYMSKVNAEENKGTNKYTFVGDIFKALIRYNAVREDGYVEGSFQISGGINGYDDLLTDKIGYEKTVDGKTYSFPKKVEGKEELPGFYWDSAVPGLIGNKENEWAKNAIVARYTITNEKGEEVPVEKYYNVKISNATNELWFYEKTIEAHDSVDGFFVLDKDGKPTNKSYADYEAKHKADIEGQGRWTPITTKSEDGRYEYKTVRGGSLIKPAEQYTAPDSYKKCTGRDGGKSKAYWVYSIGDDGNVIEEEIQDYKDENGEIVHFVKKRNIWDPVVYTHKCGYIEWGDDKGRYDKDSKDATVVKDYIAYKNLLDAQKAVTAAYDNVCTLKERMEKLDLGKATLIQLERELAQAKERLGVALDKQAELEERYGILKKTVIDLSRFNRGSGIDDDDVDVNDDDDDDDDDASSSEEPGSGAGVAGTSTIVASAGTIPVISLPTTAAGVAGARTGRSTSRRGVAGVRVDNGESNGDANGEGDAAKNVVEPKTVATTNGKGNNAAGADKKFVKLENNEVPLADKPFEEGTNMNLLWLLAAAIAAGAGVYAYDKHRKKVAAADEVKKYKKN